jgi:hypothetical protein
VLAGQQRGSSLLTLNIEDRLRHQDDEHTGIEQYESICTNEIDPAPAGLATKQEYKFFTFGIIKLIYQFLPFADGHASIKSEAAIPEQNKLATE